VIGFVLGYHDDDKEGGHPIDNNKDVTRRQYAAVFSGKV
jgi:hypothetical protein